MKETWLDSAKKGWRSPWVSGQLLIWSIILVGSFLVALFLRFSSLESNQLSVIAYLLNAVALFAGGFFTAKKTGKKGWYYGGIQGFIYTIIILFIAFLAFDSLPTVHLMLFFLSAFGISSIGGIIGVNQSKSS
jgi:putative membrane protein (TIGR04086 family)